MIVPYGLYTEQEPTIVSIVPAQACFNLTGLARVQQVPPKIHELVAVFCVKRHSPPPIGCFFSREAGVIQPSPIEEFSGAVRASRPCKRRNRVNVLRLPSLDGTLPWECHSQIIVPLPDSTHFPTCRKDGPKHSSSSDQLRADHGPLGKTNALADGYQVEPDVLPPE